MSNGDIKGIDPLSEAVLEVMNFVPMDVFNKAMARAEKLKNIESEAMNLISSIDLLMETIEKYRKGDAVHDWRYVRMMLDDFYESLSALREVVK